MPSQSEPQPQWGSQPQWGQQWGQPSAEYRPGVIPLRPLGVGELLDGALTTMRQHPRATLGLSAVVVAVTGVLQFAAQALLLSQGAGDAVAVGVSATVVATLLGALGTLILSGMLTVVIGDAVLGRPLSLGSVWRRSRPLLLRLGGASLLAGLVAIAPLLVAGLVILAIWLATGGDGTTTATVAVFALIAGVVASVYVLISVSLTTPALMLEAQRPRAALRRSRGLVRGSWWRVLGVLLLAGLIKATIQGIISAPFTIVSGVTLFDTDATPSLAALAVITLGSTIARVIVLPFSAGVQALLYVDRRMRAEGLDVTLAAAVRRGGPTA
ncbi:MAG: hypothetical protein LC640_04225 [Frankia sp.]|nr:hypothetical protein [Frankia sp.]